MLSSLQSGKEIKETGGEGGARDLRSVFKRRIILIFSVSVICPSFVVSPERIVSQVCLSCQMLK